MKLEDAFPDDPFKPSINYVGYVGLPFTVPWPPKRRIRLGVGFSTDFKDKEHLFIDNNAFSRLSTESASFVYRESHSFSARELSTSDTNDSSSHMNFSLDASVGGGLLGASGSGQLEKMVQNNRAKQKISVRSEHTRGQIDLAPLPELGLEARRVLSTSTKPMDDFRAAFGDFYVAGIVLGATNFTMLSGELVDKRSSEMERAEIDVKVLFKTFHKSHYKYEASRDMKGVINLSSYDSLSDTLYDLNAYSYEDTIVVGEKAADNRTKGMRITERVGKTLSDDFDLWNGKAVGQDTIDRLCDRGLVTELLLMPFASLRSFRAAMAHPGR